MQNVAMVRRAVVVALVVALVGLVGSPAGGGRTRVRAGGSPGAWEWQPDFKHVVKGTTVIWKNPTSTTHTVAAYSDNWGKNTTIASGERTRKRFRKTGQYLYRCTQPGHSSLDGNQCSGMCGEIHVARS